MKNDSFKLSALFLFFVAFIVVLASFTHKRLAVNSYSFDDPATHNMLILGEKSVFLSHLPMFQEKNARPMPHRYQAILEVSFEKPGSKPNEDYFKDRASHPATKIYTINPESFVLPDLVLTDTALALRRFRGTIFRGHLEKDGSTLSEADVSVKHIIHFREFDPKAKKPAELEYILFGKGTELFLAHLITGPPDFDQLLSVDVTDHQFKDEELAKGMRIVFKGSKNSPSKRLKQKQRLEGEILAGDSLQTVKIRVVPKREFYFEEGELRVPAVFDTTPEEKKAGFF